MARFSGGGHQRAAAAAVPEERRAGAAEALAVAKEFVFAQIPAELCAGVGRGVFGPPAARAGWRSSPSSVTVH